VRHPKIEKSPEGAFVLRHLPPILALAVRELPDLLSDDAPGIRRRLTGSPYPEGSEDARQWEKHAVPDLDHLFRDARDLVLKDLPSLAPEPRSRGRFRMEIPAKHLRAWLSSLAAVRVALADEHGITEEEMERELPPVLVDGKQRALLFIHLLGWLQGLLVEAGA
jgi:hypothetical protein